MLYFLFLFLFWYPAFYNPVIPLEPGGRAISQERRVVMGRITIIGFLIQGNHTALPRIVIYSITSMMNFKK
jgi:hypothetical protein